MSPGLQSAFVVGVGTTRYYKRGQSVPATPLQLLVEAIHAALADAGLTVSDVDGFTGYSGGLDNALLAHTLGVPEVHFLGALTGGGGGSAGAVGMAAMAVGTGQAEVVVTANVMQQAEYRLGRTAVGAGATGPYAARGTPDRDFTYPYGLLGVGSKFAMVAMRHMHLFGTTRDHFAEVAISTRENAIRRPTSVMRKPLTLDDYYAGRMISDPMCLFDYCLESDGAVAVVTTSAERARDCPRRPVRIVASAAGGAGRYGHSVGWMNAPDDYLVSSFGKVVADRLWARSGLAPKDMDVALCYDHFAPMVLMQLEDFGFCERGESGPFVSAGNIRSPNGTIPVNTHGGNLSEAYIMGMTHIVEGVEQLRGTAVNQVVDADLALVTGGPAALPVSAIVLGRE